MNIPSIFNDVIGPVMRGPSSSHSAAAVRIGAVARELMGGKPQKVEVRFDLKGSLPTTYLSQGSDMGLCGGFLGFTADDERLVNYQAEIDKAGLEIAYVNDHLGDDHPNTYNLILRNDEEEHSLTAISIGGGIVEVTQIDDLAVSFFGDCHGLVIFGKMISGSLAGMCHAYGCRVMESDSGISPIVFVTSPRPFAEKLLAEIADNPEVACIRPISPMLPVLTPVDMDLPFSTAAELTSYAANSGLTDLAELALAYESRRGGTTPAAILKMAERIIDLLENSVAEGLRGTVADDRILGVQSTKYAAEHGKGKLVNLGVLDTIIIKVTALMEVKSGMGVIVAAPTAGSCGGLPGSILAVGEMLQLNREQKARGLLAAGIIGVLVATKSTFSAEVCGCQAECGVSSGMTAGAVATMMGGDYRVALAAASMALQNIFGMVCDPVANRVEVPCLGKNILSAGNGLSCANLALAGFDQVIPFDEVVEAMDSVGRALPHELRCTALGGLSITPTSKRIRQLLESQ